EQVGTRRASGRIAGFPWIDDAVATVPAAAAVRGVHAQEGVPRGIAGVVGAGVMVVAIDRESAAGAVRADVVLRAGIPVVARVRIRYERALRRAVAAIGRTWVSIVAIRILDAGDRPPLDGQGRGQHQGEAVVVDAG